MSLGENISAWLKIAREPAVVGRACAYAVVVGALLIAINHGPALLNGEITRGRFISMGLTVLVPYCVSTLSSVGAIRKLRTDADATEPR